MSSTTIDDIIKQLTLEEKSSLVAGATSWTTVAVERLGIPSIMMTDGPHGLRKSSTTVEGNKATCFPTASALAATWNRDLVQQAAAHIGREAQAQDVQVVLGPGINLKRSPLGGRNFEYYSEDPVLSGELGVSFVNGLKSEGVGASVKHFAANSQEYERMTSSSEVDTRTLHELYLKAFRKVVRYSQPWSVMAAYNKINGEYATRSHYLLTEILRDKWGFGGIVVSDWGAAAIERVTTLKAGLDLEMPGGSSGNEKRIAKAVKEGELNEAILDTALRRLIPHIQNIASQHQPDTSVDYDAHHQFAQEVAGEAIVLLKNKNHILPITPSSQKKVAVIGRFAKTPRFQGAGSSQVTPTTVDNLYDALVDVWGKENVLYSEGYSATGRTSDALLKKAKTVVKKADIVIVCAGLPAIYETEGLDRKTLDLPTGHVSLINELSTVKKPIVVALTNGSAVSMPWIEAVDAVVEGWLGGQAGASALANVLIGKTNPSGKLAETFPVRIEDTPAFPYFPSKNGKALYGEGIFIGYRHFDIRDIEPLFPFGFGLSYTTFSFSDLTMSKTTFKQDETVTLKVTVKNTGKRAGKEVVQLYIGYHNTDIPRAVRELKNFEKVFLEPNESKVVSFEISPEDLEYYHEQKHDWRVGDGHYTAWIGSSSRDLPLSQEFTITTDKKEYPVITSDSLMKDLAAHPKGKRIYAMITAQASGVFSSGKKSKATAEETALALAMIGDIPIARLPALSEGMLDESFVEAVIEYCHQGRGIFPFDMLPFTKVGIGMLWHYIWKK